MRPEVLEIDGFTVFREPTRVDFADADLFAFTGPTGAGKSSLIDAMIFALYGSVPRLGEKAVAPVISQGRQDARVRLDFALGERHYTAVRVVRRGKAGKATTREARLERGDDVVAGNVRELDAEIERLIGLDLRQFTTCAVLPQGDFARFLHARPAERQKLLTQLLGFMVYGEMRQRATQRAVIGRDRMDAATHRLDELASVNKKLEEAHAARVAALTALQTDAARELSVIALLKRQIDDVAPQRRQLATRLKSLRAVKVPGDARALASELLSATQAVEGAEHALGLAKAELAELKASRDRLGDQNELKERQQLHLNRADLEHDLDEAREKTRRARARVGQHRTILDTATQAAGVAREALEVARRTHAAHELRGHLVAGESCPVCGQSVTEPLRDEKPSGLAGLEDAERQASARREAAQSEHQELVQDVAAAVAVESSKNRNLEGTTKRLADVPSLKKIEDMLSQIATADLSLGRSKKRHDDASQALIDAQRNRHSVARQETSAWATYNDVRVALAGLDPPAPRADDLAGSWVELQNWATETVPDVVKEDEDLRRRTKELAADAASQTDCLATRFAEHGIDFKGDLLANLLAAVTENSVALADVREKRKEKKRLRSQLRKTKAKVDVAETLARHLRADRFERWLLYEAFGRLSAGASKLLLELSNGQYAFRHNDRLEFEVIDHANAGEARSARTLSGGETFLASLSLALALADEVADLATEGTARLESIFIDEGFGTLDPDTLDVVATAIEELGARGRMVGVVTHVAALAERIPVQFKVAKASGNASVQRIDA